MGKIKVPSYKHRIVVNTEEVESHTSPGVFYTVEEFGDGSIFCSCAAIKKCKHIIEYERDRKS